MAMVDICGVVVWFVNTSVVVLCIVSICVGLVVLRKLVAGGGILEVAVKRDLWSAVLFGISVGFGVGVSGMFRFG